MKHWLISVLCFTCIAASAQKSDYTQYVNPFVGTGGHGHTFPGAVMPFGMVQLSPDTRLGGWDGASGYHYSDRKIYGFSHTHLSGTGVSDYCDVLLMPTTGKVKLAKRKYASSFSHRQESASPGYYSVWLDKYHIKAELTVTSRTGLHKYVFPAGATANIILNLNHRDKLKHGEINIVGDDELTGMRLSSKWADNQYLYFVIRFSKPFTRSVIKKNGIRRKKAKHARGQHLKAYVRFNLQAGDTIYAKVGISTVSIEGARKNLEAEQHGWDFERVRNEAKAEWNRELSKIEIESRDTSVMRTFYTALYHTMIAPILNSDVDRRYRGMDLKIHQAENFDYYTCFSLWDTYRALHPLLAIIDRKRTSSFVNSFLAAYEQYGLLPVWSLSSCETWCMIGYHAVPVINDAYQKGIRDFNVAQAFEAMKHSATISPKALNSYSRLSNVITMFSFYRYKVGWRDYQKRGYIRLFSRESVSKTLEYAYDDWSIAQMAKKLGKKEDFDFFIKRAQNYKSVLDTSTGFMRPRQIKFIRNFDPYATSRHYTEANAWQYSFYVPQDISGQMNLIGGKERLSAMLDSLFSTSSRLRSFLGINLNITGMIGQYAHGNEPSHQIAYEYDYVGKPWKTQAMVRRIMNEFYTDQPDGLAGNEDCGQMSAWYVFSALGFYPVCPGSNQYAIGSPLVDKAIIHFEHGKSFTIVAQHNGKENVYINSARLNEKNYTKSYLTYEDMVNGGTLKFSMSAQPNKNRGSGGEDVPVSEIQ